MIHSTTLKSIFVVSAWKTDRNTAVPKAAEDDIDFTKDELFRGATSYEHDPAVIDIYRQAHTYCVTSQLLPQQLISDVTEYVMMCNLRKWVRGKGNSDVKKAVFPAQSPYPPLPAHTQTGLELAWGLVKIEATDGKVRERETD